MFNLSDQSKKPNRKKSIKKNIKQTEINLFKINKNIQENILPFSLKQNALIQDNQNKGHVLNKDSIVSNHYLQKSSIQQSRWHKFNGQNMHIQQDQYQGQTANAIKAENNRKINAIGSLTQFVQSPNKENRNYQINSNIQNDFYASNNDQVLQKYNKTQGNSSHDKMENTLQLQVHLTISKKKYTLKIQYNNQQSNLSQIVEQFLVQNQISNANKKNHNKTKKSIIQMVQKRLMQRSLQNTDQIEKLKNQNKVNKQLITIQDSNTIQNQRERQINLQKSTQKNLRQPKIYQSQLQLAQIYKNTKQPTKKSDNNQKNTHKPKYQKPFIKEDSRFYVLNHSSNQNQDFEGCSPSFKQSSYNDNSAAINNISANMGGYSFSPQPKHKQNKYQKMISNYYNQNIANINPIVSPGNKGNYHNNTNETNSQFVNISIHTPKNLNQQKQNRELIKKTFKQANYVKYYQPTNNNVSVEQQSNPKSVYQKWKQKQKQKNQTGDSSHNKSVNQKHSHHKSHNKSFDNALQEKKNHNLNRSDHSPKVTTNNKNRLFKTKQHENQNEKEKQNGWNKKPSKNKLNEKNQYNSRQKSLTKNEKSLTKLKNNQKQFQKIKTSPVSNTSYINAYRNKSPNQKFIKKTQFMTDKSPTHSNYSPYHNQIKYSYKNFQQNIKQNNLHNKQQHSSKQFSKSRDGNENFNRPQNFNKQRNKLMLQQQSIPSQQSLIYEMSPDHFYKQGLLFQAKKNFHLEQKFNEIYPFTTKRNQISEIQHNRSKSRNSNTRNNISLKSKQKYNSSSMSYNQINSTKYLSNYDQKPDIHQRLYKQSKMQNMKKVQIQISNKKVYTIAKTVRSENQINLMKQNLKHIKGLSWQKQQKLIQKNIQIKQKIRQKDKQIDEELQEMIKQGKVQPSCQIIRVQKSPFRKTKVF